MPRNADFDQEDFWNQVNLVLYLFGVLEQMNCISHVYANRRCSDVQLREQRSLLCAY